MLVKEIRAKGINVGLFISASLNLRAGLQQSGVGFVDPYPDLTVWAQ